MDREYKERVELHCHSTYSKMDGVTRPREILQYAKSLGMSAVAITDHNEVLAFPEMDMYGNREDTARPIYGMEATVVDDLSPVIDGYQDQDFDSEYVVFDVETTGFNCKRDRIIEISAVKVVNGQKGEIFHSFLNPNCDIPEVIQNLTGISNEDVATAPSFGEIYKDFQSFVGERTLVAHNASFDMRFLRAESDRIGMPCEYASLDTVAMCRLLVPEMGRHSLDHACRYFHIEPANYHNALNDSTATADLLLCLFDLMKENGMELGDLNKALQNNAGFIRKSHAYHMTVLVQNRAGLRNLYRMISDTEDARPGEERRFQLSQLMELHEGLLYGSACDAGQLFNAVKFGADLSELKQIAKRFDFIEVQPSSAMEYLIEEENACFDSVEQIEEAISTLIKAADELDIPVVATSDAHYLKEEDKLTREILYEFMGWETESSKVDIHFRTTEEMLDEFSFLGANKAYEIVVENSNKIAEMCQIDKAINPIKAYPKVASTDELKLKAICQATIPEKYDEAQWAEVEERLEWELEAIRNTRMAFVFLMIRDALDECGLRACDIGSRGTWASSIVAYLAGISDVDPIRYHLSPEFIYGLDQQKEIDIDLNLPEEKRAAVMDAVSNWRGNTGLQGGTITTIGLRTAEAAVLLYEDNHDDFDYGEGLPNHGEIADRLTSVYKGVGCHPGGIVLIPEEAEMLDYTPYTYMPDPKDKTGFIKRTYFDYHTLDNSLLKMDLLTHDMLGILGKLSRTTGVDLATIPFDDEKILALFCGNEELGIERDCGDIPEFRNSKYSIAEAGFVQEALDLFAPKDLDDLVKFPGLMHGTNVWLDNAEMLLEDDVADAKTLMGNREDIFDYLLSLGIERETAYLITESVRKGKVHSGRCRQWPEWKALILEAGAPDWFIWSCEQIRYMFPRAHSAAYMQMAWRLGWFKVYYPKEFQTYMQEYWGSED